MNTSWKDYLASAVLLGIMALVAGSGAAWVGSAASRMLGDFRPVGEVVMFLFFYGLVSAAAVRLILRFRPLRPGTYTMESAEFFWWKLYTVVHEFGRGALLPFTTVFAKPVVAKLFGARVGRRVAVGGHFVDPPLIEVGDGAVIGLNSALVAHAITSGRIVLKPVRVGPGATVGVHTVVMPGAEIGAGAVVAPGSVVLMGTKIPPGEFWGGVPARRLR